MVAKLQPLLDPCPLILVVAPVSILVVVAAAQTAASATFTRTDKVKY